VLNYAPRDEVVWGSGDPAERILALDTRLRWVVRFTTRPLFSRRESPRYSFDRWLGGPRVVLEAGVDLL